MKKKIIEALKSFQDIQANLDSDSTIEMIADKIVQSISGDLEVERMKLAEQIVEHSEEGYIFESPDGGKTIYKRAIGSDEKILVVKPEDDVQQEWPGLDAINKEWV